jgi:hypothetical protein
MHTSRLLVLLLSLPAALANQNAPNTIPQVKVRCVDQISKLASSMRDGIGNSANPGRDGRGAFGSILRIAFDDGIKWASKVCPRRYYEALNHSINALTVLEKFCPHLPVVRAHGGIVAVESSNDFVFHFIDWVEGSHPYGNTTKSNNGLYEWSLPRNLIIQLAEFVYNLTTCPLPVPESKNTFERIC